MFLLQEEVEASGLINIYWLLERENLLLLKNNVTHSYFFKRLSDGVLTRF